jgi:hypothetical protein
VVKWRYTDDAEKCMSKKLELLLAASQEREFTPAQQEEQRRSFAFGNTHFENERITRETVDLAAEALRLDHAKNGHPAR